MPHTPRRNLIIVLCLPCLILGLAADVNAREPGRAPSLQALVDSLKARLGIDVAVSAVVVPANALLVSVQPVDTGRAAFQMTFDERFLSDLNEDELEAIVAHELGHVWIFTHHPYLQTERLANTVAMRAVPRANLERVYSKVWDRTGVKGDLRRFLGPE